MKTKTGRNLLYIALFALALCLLLLSGVKTSSAVLKYESDDYIADIELKNIDIAILDKTSNKVVGQGELLKDMLGSDTFVKPGKTYKDELCVLNNGAIDEYVRVVVYKYWVDSSSSKRIELKPEYIGINFGDGWIKDEDASTDERTVLYYPGPISYSQITAPFITGVTIDQNLPARMKTNVDTSTGIITRTYTYEGMKFVIDVEADGVQTHNMTDAIKSAWGIDAKEYRIGE